MGDSLVERGGLDGPAIHRDARVDPVPDIDVLDAEIDVHAESPQDMAIPSLHADALNTPEMPGFELHLDSPTLDIFGVHDSVTTNDGPHLGCTMAMNTELLDVQKACVHR